MKEGVARMIPWGRGASPFEESQDTLILPGGEAWFSGPHDSFDSASIVV